jgi:hypothetical protein
MLKAWRSNKAICQHRGINKVADDRKWPTVSIAFWTAALRWASGLAIAISIGLRSGEQVGRNRNQAHCCLRTSAAFSEVGTLMVSRMMTSSVAPE